MPCVDQPILLHLLFVALQSSSFENVNCHRILVGRMETVRNRAHFKMWGAIRNSWAGYRMGFSRRLTSALTPNRGSKSPLVKFRPFGWRSTKMSIGHIGKHRGWLWGDTMNNVHLSLEQQEGPPIGGAVRNATSRIRFIKIGGHLTKFWQKQICLVFWGHGVCCFKIWSC